MQECLRSARNVGWCQPLQWGSFRGSPLANSLVKASRERTWVQISERFNTLWMKCKLSLMIVRVLLAFCQAPVWMVGSSVAINISRWMVFRWLSWKTRVTIFPRVSSLSVSAPCLLCLSVLSALCSRCNLLPVCTNPARTSRFGWGLEMLQNGDERADENFLYLQLRLRSCEFPFESPFSMKKLDCVNKNKQANPCKRCCPKR